MKLDVALTTILIPASESAEELLAHRHPILKDKQDKPGHGPMHLSSQCCGEETGGWLGFVGCQPSSGSNDRTRLCE